MTKVRNMKKTLSSSLKYFGLSLTSYGKQCHSDESQNLLRDNTGILNQVQNDAFYQHRQRTTKGFCVLLVCIILAICALVLSIKPAYSQDTREIPARKVVEVKKKYTLQCSDCEIEGKVHGKVINDQDVRINKVPKNAEQDLPGERYDSELLVSPYVLSIDGEVVEGSTDTNFVSQSRQSVSDNIVQDAEVYITMNNMKAEKVLNVTAYPSYGYVGGEVEFYPYWNYKSWIEHAEIRIFAAEDSVMKTPIDRILFKPGEQAMWKIDEDFPYRNVKYVLRVYDSKNRFDETNPKKLEVFAEQGVMDKYGVKTYERYKDYGVNNIAISAMRVYGTEIIVRTVNVPVGYDVEVLGDEVPTHLEDGEAVYHQILPPGNYIIPISYIDQRSDQAIAFERKVHVPKADWFYVALGDVTVGKNNTTGPAEFVTQDEQLDEEFFMTARGAFYGKGKIANGYQFTTYIDTGEEEVGDILQNIDDKDARSIMRRLDKDRYYPTYGDDSTIQEDIQTQGKFYVRAERDKTYYLWGNFNTDIGSELELAKIDRSLYGAKAHYESVRVTTFMDSQFKADAYWAEPGTIATRQEFRGTNGSLYFLRNQDITIGSEKVRVEVRDEDTGIVLKTVNLAPDEDYYINSFQGRIVLTAPLPSTADDSPLVRSGSLSGNPVYLVVRYEYTPAFTEVDDMSYGGRFSAWVNNYIQLGMTYGDEKQDIGEQELYGADATFRWKAGTYLKVETAHTDGSGFEEYNSSDGGYTFDQVAQNRSPNVEADAHRIETAIDFDEFTGKNYDTKIYGYTQTRESGFSTSGQLTNYDTDQTGVTVESYLGNSKRVHIKSNYDYYDEDGGTHNEEARVELKHDIDEHWNMGYGLVYDDYDNAVAAAANPDVIGESGQRIDGAVQVGYDEDMWNAYAFGQGSIDADESRRENERFGAGGKVRITPKLSASGEVSEGRGELGALARVDYRKSKNTDYYLSYTKEQQYIDSEVQTVNASNNSPGTLTSGVRTRYSSYVSAYGEEKLVHKNSNVTGLTHVYGIDFSPNSRWNMGASFENGTVDDIDQDSQDRTAVSVNFGYHYKDFKWSSAVEWREDQTNTEKRRSTFNKNSWGYKINDDNRLVGRFDWGHSDQTNAGDSADADYRDLILGYAYRPVEHDKFNMLLRYNYFYDLAPSEQVVNEGVTADYKQRSHIGSVDTLWDTWKYLSLGVKYGYKWSEITTSRESDDFFSSEAHLVVLRSDIHFTREFDGLVEWRWLDVQEAEDTRTGFLIAGYKHFGKHFKFGGGYNFAEFDDDLTNLSYDAEGVFVNAVTKF